MRNLYYVFLLLLLIGCKATNEQKLASVQTITRVFDQSEIEDLEKMLCFFYEQTGGAEKVDNENIIACYQRFFEKMEAQEKTGHMDVGIPFQEQKNLYKQISDSTFMQIWDFSPCWHRDCPDDTLKCITYSYNGKYLTYLEELGNENHLIQKYHEAYHFLGDISPTMVASILLDYKNYDIRDIRIRLVIAIHYLTLNDQFERRESK